MNDLTDVGVSDALHTGVGFFGLLNAASAPLPYGWGGHEWRGPELQRFHVLHSIREKLGPLCYTGSLVSVPPGHVRRPGLDCLPFGRALNSPFGSFALTVLKSVQWFNHILRL